MKSNNLFILLIAFAIIAFTSSCKKDEITPDEITKPSLSQKTKIAEKPAGLANSTDDNAQSCAAVFDEINGIMTYLSDLDVPDDAELVKTKSTGSWTWTWTDSGITVWMTWTETDSKYTWEYDVDLQGTGRVNYFYVEENKDGSHGEMKVYGVYTGVETTEIATYIWDFADNGDLEFTMNLGYGTEVFKLIANINVDGSGDYSYYWGTTLWYYVIWNADGSGEWTYYFGDGTWSGTWV